MSIENVIKQLTDNGVMFDIKKYEEIEIVRMKSELDSYLSVLSDKLGQPLNLDNLIFIHKLLTKKGVLVSDLSQEYLKKHQYDCEELYLLYKAKDIQQKLRTYSVEKLKSRMDDNGRIHGEWYRANATTGRLICRNPALQGLPSSVRKEYMIPEEGNVFITADYSTVEMRVLAKLANDKNLINNLCAGCDIHSKTASVIYNKPMLDVTHEERQTAKGVNFMIAYGGTPVGLSRKMTIETGYEVSKSQAKKMINNFYSEFPDVYYYHYQLLHKKILPTTLKGRVYENVSGSKALNYPVQASAAEGFIDTLDEIIRTKPDKYRLVMCIHDSVTLEVPESDTTNATSFLKSTAERVMGDFIYPVPVFAEIKNFI